MTQTLLDKRLYDVLNAVALKKMATAAAVSEIVNLDTDQVRDIFAELADSDYLALMGETALPTDASGPVLVDSAAAIYGQIRTDPSVLQVADKFEDVNSRFLRTMSSWQQIEVAGRKLANDHSDSAYDAKVISTIERLVSRLEGLLEALSEKDARFRTYIGRFERSLEKVDAGDIAFVSDPTKDSVHNVWFEFHEDLLRTLGRARKE
ncbi:MAG: hypothetical protein EOP24_28660 [Hyphomicrobiales bacterium]|nr:MAG: hypothetical protein EOP24_28660 [Hyphomicrobiales bacterium]